MAADNRMNFLATGGGAYTPITDPCMDIMLDITNKKTVLGLKNYDGDSIPIVQEVISLDEEPSNFEIDVSLPILFPKLKIFMQYILRMMRMASIAVQLGLRKAITHPINQKPQNLR